MPVEQAGDVVVEVFDDDRRLLSDGLRVELDPAHHLLGGLGLIHLLDPTTATATAAGCVLADLECQLERVVAGEHVEDVALFNGLAHRVHVKRRRLLPGCRGRPNNSRVLAFGVAVNAK